MDTTTIRLCREEGHSRSLATHSGAMSTATNRQCATPEWHAVWNVVTDDGKVGARNSNP